jgi:lysophospholipase L1-like esterase
MALARSGLRTALAFWLVAATTYSGGALAEPLRYLALGDSYTIGQGISPKGRWPVQLTAALRKNGFEFESPPIIARTGWTGEQLIEAIGQANPPAHFDLVSLLIGVNNQFRGHSLEAFREQFDELLTTSIRLAKGRKDRVFVVSIPDYGYTPFGKRGRVGIGKAIDVYNAACAEIAAWHGVVFIDITGVSRSRPDDWSWTASDTLHPSSAQYAGWVDVMLTRVSTLLEK